MSLIAVAAIFLLARFAPPLEGLNAQGQGVLGVMLAGALLWITEATPIGLTAIIVVVLLVLCPGIGLSAAGSGLASEVVFFLIGSVAMGAAVEASGLSERVARFLGRMAQGSPARLYVQMIASLPAFAVLVPSAIGMVCDRPQRKTVSYNFLRSKSQRARLYLRATVRPAMVTFCRFRE